jgi:predicted DNA binding CopG/RHH family protein
MRRIKLTREEKAIEDAVLRGEYVPVSKEKFEEIAAAIRAYRKDTVLNIRINGQDLKNIKEKAHRLGIKYQTFISEILHRVARA